MEIYKPEFEKLVDVFTCQLCKILFRSPVIMKCGHSLCSTCATDVRCKGGGCSRCPLCLRAVEPGDCISNHLLGEAALCVNEIKEAISRGCSTAPRVTSDRDTGVGSEDTRSESSFVTGHSCSSMDPPPTMAPPKELQKSAIEKVVDVLTCKLCKKILREPVIMDCGHNFCLSCVADLESKVEGYWRCPLCGHEQRSHYYFNHPFNKAALLKSIVKEVISPGCSTVPRVISDRDSGAPTEDARSEVSSVASCSRGSVDIPTDLGLFYFIMEQYKPTFQKLVDILTCPQCKTLFTDPVMMHCGHNVCGICAGDILTKENEEGGSCPVCEAELRPGSGVCNNQLGKAALIVGIMK